MQGLTILTSYLNRTWDADKIKARLADAVTIERWPANRVSVAANVTAG